MKSISELIARFKGRVGKTAVQSSRETHDALRLGRARLVTYFGYGSQTHAVSLGRIVQDEGLIPCIHANTPWKNIRNLYRRIGADEMPGIRVRAAWHGEHVQTVSDANGYFRFEFSPPPVQTSGWHQLGISLPDLSDASGGSVSAMGRVLIPPSSAQFGVISDLDDTVLKTNVASRMRMLMTVALQNARTRIPFPGVAAFYRALQQGSTGHADNPMFYISKSPWSFFDLLTEFLRIHDIPQGPMLLKDYRLRNFLFPRTGDSHKLASIRSLLDFYPHLPFVLIGDSAERDPEIYAEIVRSYPQRIPAIYIRGLTMREWRREAIERLTMELKEYNCQLVIARDTEFAARHAAEIGLIEPHALDDLRSAQKSDHQPPPAMQIAKW